MTRRFLNELRDECYETSEDHGFHNPPKSVGEDIALMHSELSEAFEDYRSGHAPNEVWYENKGMRVPAKAEIDGSLMKPCGIPSEIADTIIRALDFCGAHGIDIEAAVEEKMAFNRTRPHKHGKII